MTRRTLVTVAVVSLFWSARAELYQSLLLCHRSMAYSYCVPSFAST